MTANNANFAAPWKQLGFAIGHATNSEGATGCTVIRAIEGRFRCAAHLLGRASGTRELATTVPTHLADRIDAVMLTGGSAYGLDAAAGVMRWMEEHGRGFPIAGGVVPIVPTAVIFDLAPLGSFSARPTADMAYAACASAMSTNIAEGSVGAGTGATVGKIGGIARAMKGGVGIGSARGGDTLAAAIVVTNAFGDVRNGNNEIIAGARTESGAFADGESMLRTVLADKARNDRVASESDAGRTNTTIAFVAVNASMSKIELAGLAAATSAAFYRRITPCGTAFDGDVIFAACPVDGVQAPMPVVEVLAVAAMEQAIERSVQLARGRDGIPGLADNHAHS
ncbi:MAG: P1 family peptidase [Gemmatimonadaceae bacterium]